MNLFDILSIHFWRALWLEFCALFYKRVDAKTLEELCGYINPPYSRVVDLVKKAGGNTLPLTDGTSMADLFYTDRADFLIRLEALLSRHAFSSDSAYFHYGKLKEICSPTMNEFLKRVKDKGLEGRIVARHEYLEKKGDLGYNSAIEFKRINITGDINLFLGGEFGNWKFNSVKFSNDATITIFLFGGFGDAMNFSNNLCCGSFSCFFPGVSSIDINENVFKSSVKLQVDADADHNGKPFGEWIESKVQRSSTSPYTSSTVRFFSNYVKGSIGIFDGILIPNHTNIRMVSFAGGNVIGGVSMPAVSQSYEDERTVVCNETMYFGDQNAKIDNVHFDIDERITSPAVFEAEDYKKYFIFLKNRAIKIHNREDEFKYGRQERYFDWCLADRWQDKLIFSWSRFVSNSGISWFRPAVILLGGQWLLAAIFIGKFGGCGDYVAWFQAAVESLNPLSSLPDMLESLGDGNESCKKSLSAWENSLSASIYNAVRRIFSLALIYEIVKVLRRFSN